MRRPLFFLMIAVTVAAVTPSCSPDQRNADLNPNPIDSEETLSASTANYVYLIQHGLTRDKLVYVVFTGRHKPAGAFTALVTNGNRSSYLTKPDGERILLPS